MSAYIHSDQLASSLRARSVQVDTKRVRIARLAGSQQEQDLSLPPNCEGLGRIHHFRLDQFPDWPADPLPMAPARKRLHLQGNTDMTAEVFQLVSCNWRCWYCFVPFNLLSPTDDNSEWVTTDRLVELYSQAEPRPKIIDCSGGQPDLVPEWVPWMMNSLKDAGLAGSVFLWSDDNLSNDYFWKYLTNAEIDLIASYENYARVACFKGFDADSFSFNTKAHPDLFDRQFDLFRRLHDLGIDLYAYATFTGPSTGDIRSKMSRFIDRLQDIHPLLPLRTVPLRISEVGVLNDRVSGDVISSAHGVQMEAIAAWTAECEERFTEAERALDITDVYAN